MVSIDPIVNMNFKEAFKFFTHEEVTVSLDPPEVFVGPLTEKRMFNEELYYDF